MSSKGNKQARKELERIYGKGCFFARAKLAERLEQQGIEELSFKRFVESKRYRGKPISHRITYHHLKHRAEGGKATVENGANLEEIAHQFLHSLPRREEEKINNMLREWKLNFATLSGEEQEIVFGEESGTIELGLQDDFIEIPVYTQTKKQKYNRAKVKREYQKIIDEDLEYDERD